MAFPMYDPRSVSIDPVLVKRGWPLVQVLRFLLET